ncbi:MAG: tetratricopeptide repeat protein [Phycisphaerae bacterium]|nr:tetratricopeptide repeat protein [Phycisphaerae bacterium]
MLGRTAAHAALVLLLAASGPPAGCQSVRSPLPHSQGEGGVTPLGSPAAAELRAIAEAQRAQPDASVMGAPLPPALRPEAGAERDRSLDEVLASFGEASPSPAPAQDPTWDAVRMYVTARERLASGDAAAAVSLLQTALRADPDAPTVWRELGEAQLRQGGTAAAMVAFQEAVRRGLREPRVFWMLARDAHGAGRHDDAVRLLAQARSMGSDADPALPNLIDALLGEALLASGRTGAGIEALRSGLAAPTQSAGATKMRLESGELLRRRGELWITAGDALARLGRHAEAIEAYEAATEAGVFDAWAPASRTLELLFHTGRSGDAALLLLRACFDSGGIVDDRLFPSLRRLSASPAVRRATEDVLTRIEASLPEKTPTLVSRLARARAAVAAPAESMDRLRSHLAAMPSDDEALRAALALGAAGGVRAAALCDVAIEVVRLDASIAESAGAALADAGPAPTVLLASLRDRRGVAASLVEAGVLLHLGAPDPAWKSLSGASGWEGEARAAGEALAARAAFESGRFEAALGLASALRDRAADGGASMALRLAAARALHAVRRSGEAADLLLGLTPASAPPGAGDRRRHVDALLPRAEYLASAGRPEEAADLLGETGGLDRHDERPYRALLALHGPAGPLTDQARFTETARTLRQHNPNARLFRWLATQELAQRQLWGRAEPILRALSEEDPTDSAALGLLVSAWEQRLARGEGGEPSLPIDPLEWLDRRSEHRGSAPSEVAARARVLAALDRADAALAELGRADMPLPAWGILRERILREHLGQRSRADELARERLEPLPRPVAWTIELAELQAAGGRIDEAARTLDAGLPPTEVPLSAPEGVRLAALIGRTAHSAMESARTDPGAVPAALALMRVAGSRDVALPIGLHQARLTLLLAAPLIDTGELASAALAAARQHPQPDARWELSVAAQLGSGPHRARTPAYLRHLVERSPGAPPEVVFEYFRAVGLLGTIDDASHLLAHLTDASRMRNILARFSDTDAPTPESPGSPEARLKADLAYRLGNLAYLSGDHERAARIYEIGLGTDPSHPWLCNDLAYHWVELDQNLDRAGELLERAIAQMPERASITDSLGWLRYKQGRLGDSTDAAGRAVPGAVSLLARAASLDEGGDNSTILDHLGDALWRAGQKPGAIDRWTAADSLLRRQLQIIRGSTNVPAPELQRLQSLQQSVADKVRAARDGREPAVAPLSATVGEPGSAPSPR